MAQEQNSANQNTGALGDVPRKFGIDRASDKNAGAWSFAKNYRHSINSLAYFFLRSNLDDKCKVSTFPGWAWSARLKRLISTRLARLIHWTGVIGVANVA